MPKTRTTDVLKIRASAVQKQGHDHFLLKEIHEQPEAVTAVLRGRLHGTSPVHLGGLNLSIGQLADIEHIFVSGCGTAFHAGVMAKYYLEQITGLPVSVEQASEFRYRHPVIPRKTLAVVVSQSGETADTRAAVQEFQKKGTHTLGIVNVVGITIAREVDGGIYLHAGPEISVASTKAFTTQVTALLLLGLRIAEAKRVVGRQARNELKEGLERLPEDILRALEIESTIRLRAKQWAQYNHAFYLGREKLAPIAMEGALKLKEISYVHAESYPAGEMKHGAIALVDDSLLTVFLLATGPLYEKSLSNLAEVEARDGTVVVVTNSLEYVKQHEDALYVSTSSDWTAPLVLNVVLQLVAYYIAKERGCPIDQPRNLAKSVTVE